MANESVVGVVGASGLTGTAIRTELVNRGFAVRALTRRAGRVTTAGADEVVADVYDEAGLAEALRGCTAVVDAFAAGWDDDDIADKYRRGHRAILHACESAGVPRLIVVGGAMSLLGDDGRPLIDSHETPPRVAALGRSVLQLLDEYAASGLPAWTVLTPPVGYGRRGPQGRRGHYRTGEHRPVVDEAGESSISYDDFALALVDELVDPRHVRARFTVGY